MSWRTTLPCTRAEAEAIDAADDLTIDAVLTTTEVETDNASRWRLDAYTDDEPTPELLAALRALAPSATSEPDIQQLTDDDWIAISQEGLEPIREGRFAVHTSAHPIDAPEGGRAFLIDAGRAFGTGHHATTSGCLAMLDALADRRFGNVIDFGTGTGLLAFAARWLWPHARITGTDIDPVAVEVAKVNAEANGITGVTLLVADGARSPEIEAAAPYDLLIANILAGPLSAMAPEIAALAAPHATVILSGLLTAQADQVVAAWSACGCTPEAQDKRGDWSILRLTAGEERFVPDGPPDPAGRDGWALDL